MVESGTDGVECSRKVASGRRFAGVIMYLISARDLQLERARVLHIKHCLDLFLCMAVIQCYGKERSRIRAVQMDNFRGVSVRY